MLGPSRARARARALKECRGFAGPQVVAEATCVRKGALLLDFAQGDPAVLGMVRVLGHADDQAVPIPPVRAVRCRVVVVVRRGVPVDADIAGEVLLAAGVSGFVDRLVARIATAAPKG